jgi:hypothetical protein
MLRSLLWFGLLAVLTGCPTRALYAQDQTAWQKAQLQKLGGRWAAAREEKTAPDKIHRTRVELDFSDGKLKVFVFNENATKPFFDGALRVIGVEQVKVLGLGDYGQLNLGGNETQKVVVYYDFVGEKLILVGRIGWRPWEGFHLSGEYSPAETPK